MGTRFRCILLVMASRRKIACGFCRALLDAFDLIQVLFLRDQRGDYSGATQDGLNSGHYEFAQRWITTITTRSTCDGELDLFAILLSAMVDLAKVLASIERTMCKDCWRNAVFGPQLSAHRFPAFF